jgi:hypothetical protein
VVAQPKPIPWTAAEIAQLRYLARMGLSMSQIGDKLGRSKHSVQRKVRDLSLPTGRRERPQRVAGESHTKGDVIRAGAVTLPPLPSLQPTHNDD